MAPSRSDTHLVNFEEIENDTTQLNEQLLDRVKSSHEELLEFVDACSKILQKGGWFMDSKEMTRISRLQGKAEYMLHHTVEKNFLFDPAGHSYNCVAVDFQVKETRLSHEFDLLALRNRVLEMFEWYDSHEIRQQYIAPYFPLIQSSGMGKTKLLYELKQYINNDDQYKNNYCAILVLCSSGELEGDMTQTYNEAVELEECMKREPDPELKYREVEKELERVARRNNGKPVILLFDEAQNLLVGKDNYLFNCIQWWLAKKNKKPNKVVAVFAGSTLQFALIKREPPESKHWGEYWMDGSGRYPPFYQIHTMGCLINGRRKLNPANEFEESYAYGRPLFAKMGERNLLGDESQVDILKRLVLAHSDYWERRIDSCFSVLATRVQMGQTSFQIASELVSRGYAVLSDIHLEQRVAEVCHMPDPVPARLAMLLMKEGWKPSAPMGLHGNPRKFWVEKMTEIFSDQPCVPSAGGVGEVYAALFCLFCGDVLRFQLPNNDECKNFSVSLGRYIYMLSHGGNPPGSKTTSPEEGGDNNTASDEGENQDSSSWEGFEETINASVCFIQITQNYLRFDDDMSAWTQQHFLEHLYKSRSAFYVFEDCSVFDVFGSIRVNKKEEGNYEYYPLLISIVNLPKFSTSEATSSCCAMEMMLTKAACYGGLCLVLVLGRTVHTEFDEDLMLTQADLANIPNEIVSKVVEVPNDDVFGLTSNFWKITSAETEKNEIFASHSFLAWTKTEDISTIDFLRTGKRQETNGSKDEAQEYLDALRAKIPYAKSSLDQG